MKQYLDKDEMINIVENQIINIRKNNKEYKTLKDNIDKLKKIKIIEGNINSLFKAYEEVKRTSIELRKIFSSAGINLDLYNSINYSLYYEGSRYATEELKPSWLETSEDGKTLKINMVKATEDIGKDYKQRIDSEVKTLIQKHFEKYFLALLKMSDGDKGNFGLHTSVTNKGFNRGHAGEAYEEHLQEHHTELLRMLNGKDYISADSLAVQRFKKEAETDVSKWYSHETEGATMMWQHLRHALGNQAGTVAGDVGGTQVKAIINYKGKYENFHSLSLTNITTLENGINNYSLIFSTVSAREVAIKIVDYMTEAIINTSNRSNLIKTMGEDIYKKTGLEEADILISQLEKEFNVMLIKM